MSNSISLQPLTELQLEEQLNTIVDFLSEVHPNLLCEDDGYRSCVELRPINRGEKNFMLSRSLNIWDLSEVTLERMRKFLQRHNGQPTCLFYSVFDYDNNKVVKNAKGTNTKQNKITKDNALSTYEIALDFDNVTADDYIALRERFENLGIYAIWVFSGHGYQAHILLSESISDKEALKRFVHKFRAKGFNCDPSCIDSARIMRLPETYNCKCFKDRVYEDEREDPPKCQILQESCHRYEYAELLKKLDKLPTINNEDEEAYESIASAKKTQPKKKAAAPKKKKSAEPVDEMISVDRIEYPHLINFEVPDAIAKMLACTPHGLRNKTLGFMIKFFISYYRLSQTAIYEIVSLWAKEACEPAYDPEEFETDCKRFFKKGGLNYDSALAKHFGVIDFDDFITLRKKDIVIPNRFFREFEILDGTVVRLYLAIKMLEHIEETVTLAALCDVLKISDRALRPTIKALIKSGHGYETKGNRRLKEQNTYHSHKCYSPQDGYMMISYNDVRAYVNELYEPGSRGNNELKLHLFMRWKFYSHDIFMSQENLGKSIGIARNTVSVLVHRLQKKHFLKIRYVKSKNYFDSCEYILLR